MDRAGVSRHIAMAITGHKSESMHKRYNIVDDADLRAARSSTSTPCPPRTRSNDPLGQRPPLADRSVLLLDHLIRLDKERLGNGQPDRPGRLEIDRQFKLRRLLKGKVGRASAAKKTVDIGRGSSK